MLPDGERSRRAVRWISDSIKETEPDDLLKLVNEAIFKFDLNPKESEELLHFYKRASEK